MRFFVFKFLHFLYECFAFFAFFYSWWSFGASGASCLPYTCLHRCAPMRSRVRKYEQNLLVLVGLEGARFCLVSCNLSVPLSCNLPMPQMLHQVVLAHHPGFFGKPREVRKSKGACSCSLPLRPPRERSTASVSLPPPPVCSYGAPRANCAELVDAIPGVASTNSTRKATMLTA